MIEDATALAGVRVARQGHPNHEYEALAMFRADWDL